MLVDEEMSNISNQQLLKTQKQEEIEFADLRNSLHKAYGLLVPNNSTNI